MPTSSIWRKSKVQSHSRQVREDEGPKFGSKNEDNGVNTTDQMSADWPERKGWGRIVDDHGVSGGATSCVVDWRPNKQPLIPVKTRYSVQRESQRKEKILCLLLGQLTCLMSSHYNMILEHQGHLNQHKVTHKKPAYSQISNSTQVWRIV